MPFFFSDPAKDSEFATISTKDWTKVNSQAEFSELAVRDDDDNFYLFGYFTKITDILKYADGGMVKDWAYSPQKCMIRIPKKDTEKSKLSDIEKALGMILAEVPQDKIFAGSMCALSSPQTQILLTGKDAAGKEVGEQLIEFIKGNYWMVAEVDPATVQHIKLDALKIPARRWGSFGSKGQTEYERLKDREKYLLEQLKAAGIECSNLLDVANTITTQELQAGAIAAVLDMTKLIFG